MGWISLEDRYPPEGLNVLVEASGIYTASYGLVADHSFYIGAWIVPHGEKEGHWLLWDNSNSDAGPDDGHLYDPKVHAWMPLPRHYQAEEMGFKQDEDLMEHSLFEDDPDWLYKDDVVYEQMSIEDFLNGSR